MPFQLRYHPDVKSIDIPLLDEKIKTRIKHGIETRLTKAPHLYGQPLRKTRYSYWKLRVGDYRVIYKIVKEEAWILGIIHRKKIYETIKKRL